MPVPRILRAAGPPAAVALFVFGLMALPQNRASSDAHPFSQAGNGSAASPDARVLFDAANRERTSRGLKPLAWDAALATAALRHTELMARERSLTHQIAGEEPLQARTRVAGAHFALVAENIASGPDAEEIHASWMHSPGHRANLLDRQLAAIGIAVVAGGKQLYATEDLARIVPALSLDEQEKKVGELISAYGLRIAPGHDEARRSCAGGANPRPHRDMSIVNFESTDLDKLPEAVENAVRRGRFTSASVGACEPSGGEPFSRYRFAVLLF